MFALRREAEEPDRVAFAFSAMARGLPAATMRQRERTGRQFLWEMELPKTPK
jgi:hypothetical protein